MILNVDDNFFVIGATQDLNVMSFPLGWKLNIDLTVYKSTKKTDLSHTFTFIRSGRETNR